MLPEFNHLAQFICQFHKFTNEELELIATKFTLLELKPNDYFIHAGDKVDRVGFIFEGLLLATFESKTEKKEIPYMIPKGHFISEVRGLYFGLPANMNIQAAIKSKVLVVGLAQLEELKQQIGFLESTIDKINIQELAFVVLMLCFPKHLLALEKMREFNRIFPYLINIVPEKYIAIFLGIKPEYYSSKKKEL